MLPGAPNNPEESEPDASKVELSSAEIALNDNKSITEIIRINNNLLPNFLIFSPPFMPIIKS